MSTKVRRATRATPTEEETDDWSNAEEDDHEELPITALVLLCDYSSSRGMQVRAIRKAGGNGVKDKYEPQFEDTGLARRIRDRGD